jgi:Raf kinase inhibitor-like YbhB/YbcL family protein
MNIMSTSFRHGGTIPEKFSAYGENTSPEIHIEGLTPGAKSWALIMDDPDAPRGTFTHWQVYNIAPHILQICEAKVPRGALVGTNDHGTAEYFGPRPPSGEHRYYFTAYALARKLDLPAGVARTNLKQRWPTTSSTAPRCLDVMLWGGRSPGRLRPHAEAAPSRATGERP